MIAVDTKVLVYAHRRDSEFHPAAAAAIKQLAESPAPWAIPWPCVHEFYSVVTHPRIYDPPTRTEQAIAQIDAWLASPSALLLNEGETYWGSLRSVLAEARVAGPLVHDARVVELCLTHGVRELWSADRDFSRFPRLRTTNPLV